MKPNEVMHANMTVLGNAVEFAAAVIQQIAGNAIANTVEGKLITDSYLKTAVASKIHSKLIPFTGA